jgi:hypothetical protein
MMAKNRLTGSVRTIMYNFASGTSFGPMPKVEEWEFWVRSANSRGVGPWSCPVTAVPEPMWWPGRPSLPGNGDTNRVAKLLTTGKYCHYGDRQTVCFETDLTLGQKRPLTMGDYLGYPGSPDDFDFQLRCEAVKIAGLSEVVGYSVAQQKGPRLLEHEYVHSKQWAKYGLAFGPLYEAAGLAAWRVRMPNPFESEANLYWGGYSTYDGLPKSCFD